MRNSKLKPKNIDKTMRLNILEKARDEDYCRIWLALLDSGVSRPRLLRLFGEFHKKAVPIYQREALDGVLDRRLNRLLRNVQLERGLFEEIVKRHHKEISTAFPTAETYRAAINENVTDILVLMSYIHTVLGYGHIRLWRIIDYVMKYEGNARWEVKERLGIEYAEDNELSYSLNMLNVPKQKVNAAFVKQARREMEAVRAIQGVKQ